LPVILKNGLKEKTFKDRFLIKKSWEKKQDPPFISTGYENCFSFNGKGYFLDINYKNLMEYDPELNLWSTISTYPGERNEYSHFTVFGDRFFKIGGANYLGKIYDFWEYNFKTKIWLKRENTQFSFYQAASFILGKTLFIITDSRQVWAYNESDNNFKRMNDFPDQIKLYITYVSQNKAYLVNYGQTWEYELLNDSWTRKSTNPFRESYYYNATIGFALNGTCYVLQSGQDLYKFDNLNEKWILTSKYPYYGSDVDKSSFVIGDKTYIVALNGYHAGEYPLLFQYQE
jgi:hypothetical protein